MRSLQRSPFSSKKFAQDRLKLASRRFFVLPSSYTRLSSYMSSNFFMWDEASHMESGSRPAGSFSTATMKMPFSRYVVYHVSTPISVKYVPSIRSAQAWRLGRGRDSPREARTWRRRLPRRRWRGDRPSGRGAPSRAAC